MRVKIGATVDKKKGRCHLAIRNTWHFFLKIRVIAVIRKIKIVLSV